MLVRWLCHDALGDFGLLPLLFSASDRNFLKYSSRLSKYGDRAEINKNTSRPVTTSTGIVMAKAVTGGVCVQSGIRGQLTIGLMCSLYLTVSLSTRRK